MCRHGSSFLETWFWFKAFYLSLFHYSLIPLNRQEQAFVVDGSQKETAGYRPLREAIAAHIAVTRGVRCQADHLLITSGAQAALDLTARLLVEQGDVVWMEDPGYPGAWAVLERAGAQITYVPVHADGMEVAKGQRLSPRARLAYVTPSHQFPLGMTMSLAQRLALLQWAREAKA